MFKQYFLFIVRNFKKNKGSFLINLVGLSSGLTCAILIYLWIGSELKMDNFHKKEVYQIMQNESLKDKINTVEGTPGPLAEALAAEFPEVKYAATTSPGYWLGQSKVGNDQHPNISAAGKFASSDFFKVFSFPLLQGDVNKVLKGKKLAVISESLAKKLFNTTDAIGKTMVWSNAELQMEYHAQVSGVFKDVPEETSEPFDFLISTDILMGAVNDSYRKWDNYGPTTYVLLNENDGISLFDKKIKNFLKTKGQKNYTLFTRPFSKAYLYNQTENGKITGGRIDYVKLFGFGAVLILVIAGINFTNLATANVSRRLKEIGIKKVLGVQRSGLILQYLMESVFISFVGLFISLLAVELLLPSFNSITEKHLMLHFNSTLVVMLLALTLLTGILAGLYPAIYLSGLKPVTALKGKLKFSFSALWMRQGLVIFQFVFSGILIVAVMVFMRQIQYVQTKSQGFQRENVLYFETEGKLKKSIPLTLAAIRKIEGVIKVAGMDRELLGDLSYTTGDFSWEGRDPDEVIRFQRASVTPGLIETLGMKMSSGRSFSEKLSSDTTKVVINEAGIKVMRLKNPVGKIFTLWGSKLQIIGVVQDFHFESMHKPVGPMFIRNRPFDVNRIMVRVAPGQTNKVIDGLKRFNSSYNPGYTLNYKFLDQDFQRQYQSEIRMAVLSKYFAFLAIIISCLGLFGLTTFAAERRFKEIGVRKVLGATAGQLMYLLSRDFIKPVILSLWISLPVAYVLCMNWLSTFAYRIDLKWWFFAAASLVAIVISLTTVFYQTYRAVKMNPVASLKQD
ncbi:ABC transporter permease [Pedobacter sp. PWIIR3]